jgi:aromatic-L-amino-acid decarboxylase
MSRIVSLVMRRLATFIDTLDDQPHGRPSDAADRSRAGHEPLPVVGQAPERLIETLFEELLPASINTAGPTYFGYIPGGGLPHAAIADLLADTVNRYVGVSSAAPGFAQLERTVVRWLCDIVDYGPAAGGFLTSGGSLANWSAVVTALHCRVSEQFDKAVLYASDQTHHSIKKAAVLAGLPISNVRCIRSDANFRVCLDELSQAIDRDRSHGFHPFLVVGNAGTTNTGAVDDLELLAAIARRQQLWFHVDAAYGGFFALSGHGRRLLEGLNRADSITLDPHKGLFLPYGTGSLLVKNVDTLRRVHRLPAPYLPSTSEKLETVEPSEISPELTREFRALRIWLPLKMHGIGIFRDNLEEKLSLTRWLSDALHSLPGIEVVTEPQLSTVVFRLVADGLDNDMLNRLNEKALALINDRRRIFLSPTTLRGRFVLRVCILSFRTHRKHVEQCLEEIRAVALQLGLVHDSK